MRKGVCCMSHEGEPRIGGGWNNQQLLKDCGLVPYLLHKNYGFRSVMVGLKVDAEYPYLEKYVRGLEMEFLPEDTTLARIKYLKSHVEEIDLLILYGASPRYIPIAGVYKHLRPDGKIYLSTDMNSSWAKRIHNEHPLYKKFLELCDVIGSNNSLMQEYLSTKWRVPVEFIRNGWHNFPQVSFENLFERKENIILTVGRIGTAQKQNQILLEAFAKVADELSDWKLRLVGSIEEDFKPYIEKFFERNPGLKERVKFTGLIADKAELMEEYKRAKIFCLTSILEGSPNVAAEALFSGDYIITSAIDAACDITDKGKCGVIFPIGDTEVLAKALRAVCKNEQIILSGGKHAFDYARQEFDADKIVERLYHLIFSRN